MPDEAEMLDMPENGEMPGLAGIQTLTTRPAWLDVLIRRATRFDGQPPFSDGSLVEFATGERSLLVIGDVAAALHKPGEAELVTDPDARHHGHGARLLDRLIAQNPGGLQVWAHGDHPAARGLAASRGLVPTRRLLQLRRE
jgi:mycothiol synthase